jgi:hypothetical protein
MTVSSPQRSPINNACLLEDGGQVLMTYQMKAPMPAEPITVES